MKSLVHYLKEGADLDKRTADRFFGDKLNKDRNTRNTIMKSKKYLKELKHHFSTEEYNKLLTLIDNHMDDTYNSRSYVYITLDDYKGDDVYTFVFNFRMNNMPTSIQNALSEKVLEHKFGKYNGVHSSSYINTNICYLEMSVNGIDGDNSSQIGYPDIDTMIYIVKYIIKTIEPIYDDIISFKSENDDIAIALKMNLISKLKNLSV